MKYSEIILAFISGHRWKRKWMFLLFYLFIIFFLQFEPESFLSTLSSDLLSISRFTVVVIVVFNSANSLFCFHSFERQEDNSLTLNFNLSCYIHIRYI